MYGGFTSNVRHEVGRPGVRNAGIHESLSMSAASSRRRYGIPYRTSNVCAANTVDAQAAYESVFSLWGAVNSGGHLLKHGARLDGRRPLLLL